MRKNGFTLIELLSVIVILGIIAVIAVPTINDLLDESKRKSFKNSAYGLIEAANQYYLNSKLNGQTFEELTFTVQNGKMVSGENELLFNGKNPIGSSYVKINKNGEIAISITDGENYASKDYDETGISVSEEDDSLLTREELNNRINELETLLTNAIEQINNNDSEISNLQNSIGDLNNTDVQIKNNISELTSLDNSNNIFLQTYTIGSIYISTSSTNPSSIYGGTWERYGNGKTLVGVSESETEFSSVNKTGGEKTHTLTLSEMPSHNHSFRPFHSQPGYGANMTVKGNYFVWSTGVNWANETNLLTDINKASFVTEYSGSGTAHNNLQPYITVYIWQRTA